jgi:hypothetical protein
MWFIGLFSYINDFLAIKIEIKRILPIFVRVFALGPFQQLRCWHYQKFVIKRTDFMLSKPLNVSKKDKKVNISSIVLNLSFVYLVPTMTPSPFDYARRKITGFFNLNPHVFVFSHDQKIYSCVVQREVDGAAFQFL